MDTHRYRHGKKEFRYKDLQVTIANQCKAVLTNAIKAIAQGCHHTYGGGCDT
jgi:hypothetical protein